MAQTLSRIILFRSRAFQQGYIDGCSGKSPRWCKLSYPLDEEKLVNLVRNLCELYNDEELTEEMLHRTVGLLAGWIVACKQ
jgi:hypothetical protein